MKRSTKSLIGFNMKETDGEIGKVVDFYFDDYSWKFRYLIVETGGWLSRSRVLVSPKALQKPDWEHKEFPVNLTKEQIQSSPDVDSERLASGQTEDQLFGFHPWGIYWGKEPDAHGAGIFGMMPSELASDVEADNESDDTAEESVKPDPHLRSTKELMGYTIHATDGEIGKVVDYIVDDTDWQIKFFVVETGSWMESKKVILSIEWIKEINWENENVIVNITTKAVEESPEFDASQPISDVYEQRLYDHYENAGKDN